MDPLTPLDTLCRIILRGREYEAQTQGDYDPDEAAGRTARAVHRDART